VKPIDGSSRGPLATMAIRRGRSAAALAPTIALAVGLWTGGCQRDLSDIDRHVQQLLAQRSAQVGPDSVAPARSFGPPETAPSDRITSKSIPTDNPRASELSYAPADEARDFAQRLKAYSDKAIGRLPGQEAIHVTLAEALRIGQRSASEYLSAEEQYILASIRLLIERHAWGPRFFDDASASLSGQGTEGDFQHAAAIVNNLRVTQQLPYGGTVEAAWVWRATEQLREQATGRYQQSSELTLSANIPLLRGAGLVAQESLIQSERNLIYQARSFEDFRRQFFVDIAHDYFDLLQAAAQIKNQEGQLENVKRIEAGQKARFEAGRVAAFEVNTAANNVLQATASLAGQYESYILQLDRFKLRLGLKPEQVIQLDEAVLQLPAPEITLDQATALALEYRLDLQNRRDQLDDARRALKNARNQLLPDLNATAQVGVPTDPAKERGGVRFQPEDLNYQTGITLGLPLDRQIERLGVRQATIALAQQQRDFERFRDQVGIDVRQAVRNIDLSRFQLKLAEDQVRINERRVKELELKAAEVDTQRQLDAADNLQQSKDALARAQTDLRNAVLNYLKTSGQLRIARDGTFLPLPGMDKATPAKPGT